MSNLMKYLYSALLLMLTSSVYAIPVMYHNEADFLNALSGSTVNTLDFDSQTAGDVIASGDTVNGATFSYVIAGGSTSMLVDDFFDTTSLDNYLSTDDGSGAFYSGDSFTLTFSQKQFAIGMYILTDFGTLFDDDLTITTSAGQSVSNSAVPDLNVSLLDGDAYYLGLIESDMSLGFDSITLSSLNFNFLFNVDDISSAAVPTPSPGIASLIGLGLLFISFTRRYARVQRL